MATIRLNLSKLFSEDERAVALTEKDVLAKLSFLPKPSSVEFAGDDVVVTFPSSTNMASEEAERLARRAANRAQEGNYDKAIGILKRALELDPLLHSARRDLAMTYVETGETDEAVNHLIEVLRLNPDDSWSWVVLANLYINQKNDEEAGRRFLQSALAVDPNDAWALNSLATLAAKNGDEQRAIRLFEQAIESNPAVANPYVGLAMVYSKAEKIEAASEILARMFRSSSQGDLRSEKMMSQARDLFDLSQNALARKHLPEAKTIIQDYTREIEITSGFPVRISETVFQDKVGASIQMAWKKNRDYHLLQTREGYPEHLLPSIEAHELTHVKLEVAARKEGTNRWYTTTPQTREFAKRAMANDVKKLRKDGYGEDSISKVTDSLIGGLASFLYNCPLDMLIEREIRSRFPALRASQYLSVSLMAEESRQVNDHPKVRTITPRKVLTASIAMNGAYALFLDDLLEGTSAIARHYHNEATFELSQRIFEHCRMRFENLSPGEEYDVVDEIAEMVGLTGWFEWMDDKGVLNEFTNRTQEDADDQPENGGVTNPLLLAAKAPAAAMYFVNILKRFKGLTIDEIRAIGYEVALLGQHGLDYSNANDRYNLRTIPGEKFTGLQLMCLLYASFKEFEPNLETGIDLGDEYTIAKRIVDAEG